MRKYSFFTGKRVSMTWFVSYIIVSLITVLFNFIAYVKIDIKVSEQNGYYVREILENRRNDIDSLCQFVANVAIEIAQKDTVQKLAFMKESLNGENYMNVYNIRKDLEVYKKLENEFDNVYIYFYNTDYCVSLNSACESDVYYAAYIKPRAITKSEWMQTITNNQNGNFAVFSSDTEKKVTYFYSVYGVERFVPYATIAIEIDRSKFLNESAHLSYNENFYIYDGDDIFLSFDEAKKETAGKVIETYGVESGIRSLKNNMIMITADSENGEWKYFYLVDKRLFAKSVNQARLTIVVFNLVGILIMLLVALFLARSNYNPIKNIISIFSGDRRENESEFQYIQSKILSVMNENIEINRRINSIDNELVSEALLARLMSEKLLDAEREKMIETLINVGVLFPNDKFAVMLMYIEINIDMFFDNGSDVEENYRLAKVAIVNIIDEILVDSCTINYCNLNGSLCCVVNLKNGSDINEIAEKMKWVQKFANENLNIAFSVGISVIHEDIDELGICLSEAEECIKERLYYRSGVICYHELQNSGRTVSCLPDLVEKQLTELLRNGNSKAALNILDGVFDNETPETVRSIQALKCIFYNLIIVINRAFANDKACDYEKVAEVIGLIENLEFNSDIKNLREKLYAIIEDGCTQNKRETTDKLEALLKEAKLFVDEQYMDINMSVTEVAQHINVSLQYLSTNFKKRYRTGLAEYITLVRIEHAKTLLKETNISIADISQKVGYVNTRSFFRNFMRIVGTSPKGYRNSEA